MVLFRWVGRFLMLLGFVVLALGLAVWLGGADVTREAGFLIADWHRPGLNATQAFVERYLHPGLWRGVAVPLLLRPLWEAVLIVFLACLVPGGVLALIGQRGRARKRRSSFR